MAVPLPPVSPEHPCLICDHPDWCWRSPTADISYCRRIHRADGVECQDRNKEVYYRYGATGGATPNHHDAPEEDNRTPRADNTVLDRAYSAMLASLGLSDVHRAALIARGMSETLIASGQFASLPGDDSAKCAAIEATVAAIRGVDILSVPGFFSRVQDGDVQLAGVPGLLIPVREVGGLVCAVRIRVDSPLLDANGKASSKYRWLSAPNDSLASRSGAHVHVPRHDPSMRTGLVRITEGELKAEIAMERTGILTISSPGAGAFERSVAVAKQLGARQVLIAYDADARTNPHVAAALQRCAVRYASEIGAEGVGVETWPDNAGKGIDDVLVGVAATKITRHFGGEAWTRIEETACVAGSAIEPVVSARATLVGIGERLTSNPDGTAFDAEVVRAASILSRVGTGAEYAVLRRQIQRAKVGIGLWEKAVRAVQAEEPNRQPTARDSLPSIVVSVDEATVASEAVAALAASPEIFQRGGSLVRVVSTRGILDGITRPAIAPRIITMQPALLRQFCSASARWMETKDDALGNPVHVEIHPPMLTVQAIHQLGCWDGVRRLESVVEWPVLRRDGSILATPGYDDATGLYYAPNGDVPPPPPEVPTSDDVGAALMLLREVFWNFPFATDAHRAACIAALLTPFARYAFHGPAPLMLIDANTRGSGKSLLADVISEIVGGRPMARMAPAPDDNEERKRITSLALSGETIVLIDNVTAALGTPSLDAALTATEWKDRVLGFSQMLTLPLAITWFATGNNVTLVGDTSRRCLHIRMESSDEKPEERAGFLHTPLLPWVRANRPRIISAVLTLLRAYVVAGRPDMHLPAWGSFEGWSSLVRHTVVWAGLPDPGVTRIELQAEADDAANALGALIAGWEEVAACHNGQCTVAQAMTALNDDYDRLRFRMLREALAELVPSKPDELPNNKRVGATLKKYRGRVVEGRALVKAGERGENGNVWTVRLTTAMASTVVPSVSTGQTDRPDRTQYRSPVGLVGAPSPANDNDAATASVDRAGEVDGSTTGEVEL